MQKASGKGKAAKSEKKQEVKAPREKSAKMACFEAWHKAKGTITPEALLEIAHEINPVICRATVCTWRSWWRNERRSEFPRTHKGDQVDFLHAAATKK
jgi:hypothetical protein